MAPLSGSKNLRSQCTLLRSKEAEPDALRLGTQTPEPGKVLQVSRTFHHLTGDRAVNCDLGTGDILQDAVIGCRLAPQIMLGLQTIDRNYDVKPGQCIPVNGNLTKCTGHELHVDSTALQLGQQFFKLAKSHQRITAHQRNVEWAVLINQVENSLYQRAAL